MMKIKMIFFILFLISVFSQAEEISVVEVKRNIPLSDDDTVYKDYALNAGSSAGLKKNLVVFVKRKVSVKDASDKAVGEIETNVAQLKIIHVDSKVSIAREYKLISRDDEPMLEQIGVMAGDRIDLAGSFVDTKPLVYEKKKRVPSSVADPVKKTDSAAPVANPGDQKAPTENMPTVPNLQIRPNPTPLPEI